MAQPIAEEEKYFAKIKRDNINVHPMIWELINHYVRNDLNCINFALSEFSTTPGWVLRFASWIIRVIYKLSFKKGPPPADLEAVVKLGQERAMESHRFLKKLKNATCNEAWSDKALDL